jgi:glycosyltransferase involved in cell wall biosynthesis
MDAIVTIAICTSNNYNTCARLLNSLFVQDFNGFNVIIQDNTPAHQKDTGFIKKLIKDKLNYKYIYKNYGNSCSSRNLCIKKCKTKYIHFLDDDVVCPKNFCKNLSSFLYEFSPSVVGSKVIPDWNGLQRPEWMSIYCLSLMSMIDHGSEVIKVDKKTRSPLIIGASICFLNSALKEFGGFTESLGRNSWNESLISNDETQVISKMLDSNLDVYYAPNFPVYHLVHEDRLKKSWIIKRSAWQAVSDIISNDTSFYESFKKKSFIESCYISIFTGRFSNIEELSRKVRILTYFLLSGIIK